MNPTPAATPLNPPVYIEKDYDINFKLSIFESFLLILIAELGDKTFIMLIILQLKTNRITVFVSSLFAEILMNFFAICLGYLIDFLLYKNLIDYIGIMIAFIYGSFLLGASFREEDISFENELFLNQKNYDVSFTDLLDESKAEKKEESLKNSRYPLDAKLETISEVDASKEESKHFQIRKDGHNFAKESEKRINEMNKKEEEIKKNDTELIEALNEILDKDKEEEEDTNIDINAFWTIFRTMCLSEFFDRSQLSVPLPRVPKTLRRSPSVRRRSHPDAVPVPSGWIAAFPGRCERQERSGGFPACEFAARLRRCSRKHPKSPSESFH